MLTILCQILGALLVLHIAYRIYSFINLYFIHTSTLNSYLLPNGKAYALVTGATDGIGLALVNLLLSRGFNVLIHSRSEEKLSRIARKLSAQFPGRHVRYVASDATDPETAVAKVVDAVKSLDGTLTVLVNNLGGQTAFGDGKRTYNLFKDIPLLQVQRSMNLNLLFPVQLTHGLLPYLSPTTTTVNTPGQPQTQPHQRGLILNLGSYAGVYPIPHVTPYALSKAALHHFSRGLAAELALSTSPLEVLGILIGEVKTTGQAGEYTNFLILSAEEMARSILERVGCGSAVVTGSWRHCVSSEVLKWVPDRVRQPLLNAAVGKLVEVEKVRFAKVK